jgi:hypothetical protein
MMEILGRCRRMSKQGTSATTFLDFDWDRLFRIARREPYKAVPAREITGRILTSVQPRAKS